jgi:hypothetical protein
MSSKICSESIGILHRYLKDGLITTKSLIEKLEKELVAGEIEPEMFSYAVKYFTIIDRIHNKRDDEYINIEELVTFGLFDSKEEIEEIEEIISSNPDIFGDKIKIGCLYPEPSEEEISQHVDSEDMTRVCIVCFRRRRHTIILPCGHNILCSVCSKQLVKSTDKCELNCPVCKNKVYKIQRVFT